MASIATTTNTTPFEYQQTLLDRGHATGYLYAMIKGSTANTYDLYRSTNNGTSWALLLSLTRANVVEIGPIFVLDPRYSDELVWCYRTNESSQDRIYYRGIIDLTGTPVWSTEVLVAAQGNGGVAGAYFTGMDVKCFVVPSVLIYVMIAVGTVDGSSVQGVALYTLTGLQLDTMVANDVVSGEFEWANTSGSAGRSTPTMEVEHNGDGKTALANTPNLWIAFGRSYLGIVKIAWNGSGWTGPSTHVNIRSDLGADDSIRGVWDGTRFLVAVPNPSSTSTVVVVERNKANSNTTNRTTPTHPTGVVRHCTVSYAPTTGDIRVFAVGTSTTVLYYVDYVRATGLWGSWATVTATAVLGATGNNYGVRRGTYGNAHHDVYTAHTGSVTTHTVQLLPYAPNTPTWNLTGAAYTNGGAAEVAATLPLAWVFSDVDSTDTQSAYALSRQIGAGALNYWRASDSTWQVAEVQNTSGTNGVTLPAGWVGASGSDANHTYKVKVWDQTGLASGYSAALILVPSVKSNPTITAPTAAQVLGTTGVTITWTVGEQTAYQVTLATMPGANPVFVSGWKTDAAARSYVVPYALTDGFSGQLWLETKNNEGLRSSVITVNFTVDFVEPPAPSLAPVAMPASGLIRVTITNPTPAGTQPAFSTQALYRRAVGASTAILNSNPYFETNATNWTGVGATILRDSAQFHQGANSLKVTPTGAANAYAECELIGISQSSVYWAQGWLRCATALKPPAIWIHWFTAADVFISSAQVIGTATASNWIYLQVFGTPVATAAKAKVAMGVTGTPAATDFVHIDEVRLLVYNPDPGIRLQTSLATGAVFDDWTASAVTDWEYRALVTGANGATILSPWQN